MNSNIIDLLKSKPHNLDNLTRYIKFIDACELKNCSLPKESYLEKHHILPKAKNWFFDYKDFKKHPWNLIKLTARQHIIAHIMLWKAFGEDQFLPLYYMIVTNTNHSIRKEEIKCYSIKSRLVSRLKLLFNDYRMGKATYKDSDGNRYFLHKDDPKIKELGLKGNQSGFKVSEETKQILSFRNMHLKLYLLNFIASLKIDDPLFYERLYEYESQGWVVKKTQVDEEFCKQQIVLNKKEGYQRSSEKKKGRMRYMDQNGVFIGWFTKDDPEIEERNLKVQWTENNYKQVVERSKKSAEIRTGTNYYNNGIVEVQRKEHPGEGWVVGRLPRTSEHYNNQVEGIRKARLGKIVYNDGVKNFAVDPSITPDPHWIRGMVPRKKVA